MIQPVIVAPFSDADLWREKLTRIGRLGAFSIEGGSCVIRLPYDSGYNIWRYPHPSFNLAVRAVGELQGEIFCNENSIQIEESSKMGDHPVYLGNNFYRVSVSYDEVSQSEGSFSCNVVVTHVSMKTSWPAAQVELLRREVFRGDIDKCPARFTSIAHTAFGGIVQMA